MDRTLLHPDVARLRHGKTRLAGLLAILLPALLLAALGYSCDPRRHAKPPFQIVTEAVPPFTTGRPGSFVLQAANGKNPCYWFLTVGTLPPGLAFGTGGVITGTPTETGNWSITILAADSSKRARTVSRQYNISVRALPRWTVLFYLDGDNDLEKNMLDILNEVERVGSTDNVNFVALIDRTPYYDFSSGNWTDGRIYYIMKDCSAEIVSPRLYNRGQVDMSSSETLADFATGMIEMFPAERCAIVLNNHGGACKGLLADETSRAPGVMSVMQLENALAQIAAARGGKIDLVVFDACLMANLETLAAISPHASFAVASEEVVPVDGLDYETTLGRLVQNPGMNASELAAYIADDYDIKTADQSFTTMSAVDLSKVADVAYALDNLADALGPLDNASVFVAANSIIWCDEMSSSMESTEFPDVSNFAYVLGETSQNAAVATAALAVMQAVNECVISNAAHQFHARSGGLTVYLPSCSFRDEFGYDNIFQLPATASFNWNNFVSEYCNALQIAAGYPQFACFDALENAVSYAQSKKITFAASASSNDVRFIGVSIYSEKNGYTYLWDNARYSPMKTLPNGQSVGTGDWSENTAYTWDGMVWALDNGTHSCRITLITDILEPLAFGAAKLDSRRDVQFEIDTCSGKILYARTFDIKTFAGADIELTEGMVIRPYIIDDLAYFFMHKGMMELDGALTVGPAGLTLKKVPIPAGTYTFEADILNFNSDISDWRSIPITAE
jgi:hypothetical protein